MKLLLILFLLLNAPKYPTYTGITTIYSETTGVGYIVDNTTNEEYIVYDEGLIDEIQKGMTVTFCIKEGRKGFEAYNVRMKFQ